EDLRPAGHQLSFQLIEFAQISTLGTQLDNAIWRDILEWRWGESICLRRWPETLGRTRRRQQHESIDRRFVCLLQSGPEQRVRGAIVAPEPSEWAVGARIPSPVVRSLRVAIAEQSHREQRGCIDGSSQRCAERGEVIVQRPDRQLLSRRQRWLSVPHHIKLLRRRPAR